MICLDTNYLIRSLLPGAPESDRIVRWIDDNEAIILPTVAWYEFLCGASEEEEKLGRALVTGGLRDFHESEAREAARLFKLLQNPRRLRIDAMIAGTALAAGARLATNNRIDFEPFVPHGLQLA